MNIENQCPVCGYEMNVPPKDYNVCPSCGTEFGVHDLNSTIADLRDAWIESGPKWWSRTTSQPVAWDPLTQMADAGIVVKREPTSEPSAVSTSSSTAVVVGRDGWVAAPVGQPGGKPHAWEFR
jgi:hypothetical protein